MSYKAAFIVMMVLGWICAAPVQAAEPQKAGYILEVIGKGKVTNKALKRELIAKPKMNLFVGDEVWTGPNSEIRIVLADDSLLQLGADSKLVLSNMLFESKAQNRDAQIEVPGGVLRVLVNDLLRGRERKFEVHTPTAVAAVRGTLLMVLVPSAKTTTVVGYDNPVSVAARDGAGKPVVVGGGTFSNVVKGKGPTIPAPLTPAQNQQYQKMFRHPLQHKKSSSDSEQEAPSKGGSGAVLPGTTAAEQSGSQAGSQPGALSGSPPGSLAGSPPGAVTFGVPSGKGFTPPGQGGTPPGQDKDKTPPGQDKDKTPPGQDKDKTPPGQDKDKTPPGQDKDKTPPGQDKDKTPPGQDKDKDKDKTPPGQDKKK
jgi:hypothetical protein